MDNGSMPTVRVGPQEISIVPTVSLKDYRISDVEMFARLFGHGSSPSANKVPMEKDVEDEPTGDNKT